MVSNCKRTFIGGQRLDGEKIWREYVDDKQTYVQLALRYKCATKTIRRKRDAVKITPNFPSPRL